MYKLFINPDFNLNYKGLKDNITIFKHLLYLIKNK